MAKTRALTLYRAPRRAAPRSSAPIIIRPRAAPVKHKKHRRRGGGIGGGSTKTLLVTAVAGYVLGMVDKSGTTLPTVPMLGRAGTVAAAAYFIGKGQGIWGQVALAAAAIAGYEMGTTGKISGEPVPQISGLAAQV